jgi:transketolase
MALANRLKKIKANIYVLTGDGELQEGQIWESLQTAANAGLSEITAIVDHNKIQSDVFVRDTSDLGNLEDKWKAFGWAVFRCDGNDIEKFSKTLAEAKKIKDRPQVIIADTLKGKGVSFMEKLGEDGLYKFHSGAPAIENYNAGFIELSTRVNKLLAEAGEAPIAFESKSVEIKQASSKSLKLNTAYGDELVKIARERKDIVGLDADLVLDTGLIPFKKEFPDRYIECGIAEQDMVSIAGGLALRGILPIVHSFACFLSTRPNEQIYNNATEHTKIIYTASLAGLLPATPGHSHQSVRDISAIGSVPGLTLFEPSCEEEVRMAIRWAVEKNPESTYIRICNVPAEISYSLPIDYKLEPGCGVILAKGSDVLFIGYGPIMLEQAVRAREILAKDGISAGVVNLPWLNMIDKKWLENISGNFKLIVSLDDHYIKFGTRVEAQVNPDWSCGYSGFRPKHGSFKASQDGRTFNNGTC